MRGGRRRGRMWGRKEVVGQCRCRGSRGFAPDPLRVPVSWNLEDGGGSSLLTKTCNRRSPDSRDLGEQEHVISEIIDRMKLDLELRGRSGLTIDAYLRTARALEAFHGRSASELGEVEVRAFLRDVIERAREASRSSESHWAAPR